MDLNNKSLQYHQFPFPGKLEVACAKPCASPADLTLAYTPGVAAPCRVIVKDPDAVYRYTIKGNTVAVVTDGSAVLGLGSIGPLAAMPVMEGKSMLLKMLAGINGIPLSVNASGMHELVEIVTGLEPNFGAINLEDIKAPECFIIERMLQERLHIPVFHDDQHGTAVIVLAALRNSLAVLGKSMEDVHIVINGAGAAGIACAHLLVAGGVPKKHLILVDRTGVVCQARTDLNEYKKQFATDTSTRTLADALRGADVFIGVSQAGVVSEEMVRQMNGDPIIFALANPDPEIDPDAARRAGAAVVATGRSDRPNQVNNALGFPGIFRGALDARARAITTHMKLAAATAIAGLVDAPAAEYIIPNPFDARVVPCVARAVAETATAEGAARVTIDDFDAYEEQVMQKVRKA